VSFLKIGRATLPSFTVKSASGDPVPVHERSAGRESYLVQTGGNLIANWYARQL
jgi:hypothetical protein